MRGVNDGMSISIKLGAQAANGLGIRPKVTLAASKKVTWRELERCYGECTG
jgi:hypothetical protein